MFDLSGLDPRKTIASVFLLPDCDMSCAFCASESGFEVADSAAAAALLPAIRSAGFRSVVLGGGEPFRWPHDLAALGRRARDLGLLVQVGSNALAPPPGFARFDWVDRYLFPLEAARPELHDRLRSAPGGHFRRVLEALDRCQESAKPVTIGTVVTSRNLAALPELAAFLRRRRARGLRLHAWHLYRFLPVGRGGARGAAAELAVATPEYRAAVDAARAEPLGFPVYRRDDMLRSSTVEFFWFEGGALRVGSAADGAG